MNVDLGQRKLLQIRTPEGVVFRLAIAGAFTRALAYTTDFFIIIGLAALINYAIDFVLATAVFLPFSHWIGGETMDVLKAIHIVMYFVIGFGYGIYTEWNWRGQSVGKRIFRIRVMDASGLRLQLSQIFIRNLLRAIDFFPSLYLVGGLFALSTRYGQRLGDLAANTVVVMIPSTFHVDVSLLQESRYNSFRESPHLESRLRQKISPQEAAIALDAVLRRDEMDPAKRVELFQQLATHYKSVVQMPADANEILTDEQYVRNLTASLYRQANTRMT